MAEALNKVNNLPDIGALTSPGIVERHPALFGDPDTDLKVTDLTFTLEGPRITSHDINVRSTDYEMTGDGWFDMDKNVDMKAHLLMSKAFSADLAAEKKNVVYVEDAQGQSGRSVGDQWRAPQAGRVARRTDLGTTCCGPSGSREGSKLLQRFDKKSGGILGEFIPGTAASAPSNPPTAGNGTPNGQPSPSNPLGAIGRFIH